jgi:release factor glutamine methyltransferase
MEYDGLFVATHSEVYEPHDDTFLLAKVIKDEIGPGQYFCEVGCGAGIVAMTAARKGANVVATDANPHAVTLARHNFKQNKLAGTIDEADLLAGQTGPFDAVAFNPPYLPTEDDEKVSGPLNLAFDGGPDGNETVLRFVAQLSHLVRLPGRIFIVHSSLSDAQPLIDAMTKLGYSNDVVAEESHFFERLWVRRFSLKPN